MKEYVFIYSRFGFIAAEWPYEPSVCAHLVWSCGDYYDFNYYYHLN